MTGIFSSPHHSRTRATYVCACMFSGYIFAYWNISIRWERSLLLKYNILIIFLIYWFLIYSPVHVHVPLYSQIVHKLTEMIENCVIKMCTSKPIYLRIWVYYVEDDVPDRLESQCYFRCRFPEKLTVKMISGNITSRRLTSAIKYVWSKNEFIIWKAHTNKGEKLERKKEHNILFRRIHIIWTFINSHLFMNWHKSSGHSDTHAHNHTIIDRDAYWSVILIYIFLYLHLSIYLHNQWSESCRFFAFHSAINYIA